jgi:hypothetical protein
MSLACPSFVAAVGPALCRPVDNYCERLGPQFDAEPVNALTNLAFLVAGYVAWRLYVSRRDDHADGFVVALIVCMPIVGLGSMLFHTVATRWTEWADVIPILAFMLLFLWLVMRRWLGWSRWVSALSLMVFFAATFILEAGVPSSILWGGAMYLPTVLVLVALAVTLLRRNATIGRTFFVAVAVFLASFAARSIDAVLCPVIPLGTHFLWHLLNALLLFLLTRALIRFPQLDAGASGLP